MRVVVFGSTGALGSYILRKLVREGHTVRAVARRVSALDALREELGNDKLSVVSADVMAENAAETVAQAIQGQDAVICTLGPPTIWSRTFVVQTGIKHILAGMKAHSVSRLIQISSWGTHPEPYDSYFFTYFVTWLLKYALEDHRAAENLIFDHGEGIRYTIIRPPGLNNGPETGKVGFHLDKGSVATRNHQLSRADVAYAAAKVLEDEHYFNHALAICAE